MTADANNAAARRLILGSSSPRRHQLIAAAGLSFTLAHPDIDESPLPAERAARYVARLSHEKACAVAAQPTIDGVILTADTTVADDGVILGKPADAAEATAMLTSLRGRVHYVHTGVTVWDTTTGEAQTIVVTSEVHMRQYTDAEMAAYIESGDPFGKAGSYAIQNTAFHPVDHLNGCYTNVVGLPMCTVCALLTSHGITLAAPPACAPDRLPCLLRTALE
jgi:septum formation protein